MDIDPGGRPADPSRRIGFERAFAGFFEIRAREPVAYSERTMYLTERREPAPDRGTAG